jgi:hypothetical protein
MTAQGDHVRVSFTEAATRRSAPGRRGRLPLFDACAAGAG